MKDNYTSFKVHNNYYAGILDVIEDLPESEKNSILAEYFLAFHKYGNTRQIPEFKNKIAQGFFKTHLYSIDKSFADNDVYCASHDIGSYGGKQKSVNAQIKAAEKKLQESYKKLENLEAQIEQAEQLNTVKTDTPEVEDNQTITNSDTLKTGQLQKTQQPHKPQQVQKEQQLTKQEKQKAQISKIVSKLNWNTTAGLELSDEDKHKIVEIRLNNKKIHRDQREYTQSALNLSLPQIKLSLDNGIHMKELLEAWEGNGWIKWMNAWYAKEIASDLKAQSQTAKTLKSVQAVQESKKDNNWEDLKMTDTAREMIEISYKSRMNETNKVGN
jgi:hypothetical protein